LPRGPASALGKQSSKIDVTLDRSDAASQSKHSIQAILKLFWKLLATTAGTCVDRQRPNAAPPAVPRTQPGAVLDHGLSRGSRVGWVADVRRACTAGR
jgi:hypothetical protein